MCQEMAPLELILDGGINIFGYYYIRNHSVNKIPFYREKLTVSFTPLGALVHSVHGPSTPDSNRDSAFFGTYTCGQWIAVANASNRSRPKLSAAPVSFRPCHQWKTLVRSRWAAPAHHQRRSSSSAVQNPEVEGESGLPSLRAHRIVRRCLCVLV